MTDINNPEWRKKRDEQLLKTFHGSNDIKLIIDVYIEADSGCHIIYTGDGDIQRQIFLRISTPEGRRLEEANK